MHDTLDDKLFCYNAEELRFLAYLRRISKKYTNIHILRNKLTGKVDNSDVSSIITQNAADDKLLCCSEKELSYLVDLKGNFTQIKKTFHILRNKLQNKVDHNDFIIIPLKLRPR